VSRERPKRSSAPDCVGAEGQAKTRGSFQARHMLILMLLKTTLKKKTGEINFNGSAYLIKYTQSVI
jgi:hypothetical protein